MPRNPRGGKPGRPRNRVHALAAARGIVEGRYPTITAAALAHIRDHFPRFKYASTTDAAFVAPGSPEAERLREFRDLIHYELDRWPFGSLRAAFTGPAAKVRGLRLQRRLTRRLGKGNNGDMLTQGLIAAGLIDRRG